MPGFPKVNFLENVGSRTFHRPDILLSAGYPSCLQTNIVKALKVNNNNSLLFYYNKYEKVYTKHIAEDREMISVLLTLYLHNN